jgi:elongation factor Ts
MARAPGKAADRKGPRSRQAEAMMAKIAEGSVQKFLKEVTLLGQVFVKEDGKQTIEQLLKAKGASVAGFTLLRGRRGHREEGGRFRRRSGCTGCCAAPRL